MTAGPTGGPSGPAGGRAEPRPERPEPERPESERPESERSDWTDQDLLTRDEAGERIRAEIAETRERLDRTDPSRAEERAALERRLAALRAHAAASAGPSGA